MKLVTKKFNKSAFTYLGHQEYKIAEKVKKKTEKVLKKTFWQKLLLKSATKKIIESPTEYEIYCGPLKTGDKNLMDLLSTVNTSSIPEDYKKIIEKEWTPNPQLTVFDHQTKTALTAADADKKRLENHRWMPMYFTNPLQSYDYIVYESLIKNTLLGPVMRTLMKFIMGTGFKPELELRNPSGDEKKDAELIEAGKQIITDLEYVDTAVTEKGDTDGIDISFKLKMTNMIHNMLVYNRSCGVFVYDTKNPIMINGKAFPELPVNIVDFHPKDIGLVKISPDTHKMVSVQINQISGFVDTDEMIYLWNSDNAAPVYNAKYYGASMMMPMINPARIVQSQIQSIWPAISENMAGGLYHIFIAPEGGTKAQKEAEYKSITEASVFGTSNVFMIDPERVQYENVNFDPKIGELIEMFNMLVKYILACANVPQIGFFDEAAANHATAVEKIQLTISTVINPMRDWIGDEISRQWYNRTFKIIYKGKKELETYKIKVAFEDLQVETLKERAEGLEIIERRAPVTHKKAGEILQIDGYEDSIDEEREPVTPREEFEVQSSGPMGGEKFNVKSKN